MLKSQKRDGSISTYLLDIKRVVNSIATTGFAVSSEDHINAILDDLLEEYNDFISSITSCLDLYIIEDIDTLLLAQKDCFKNTSFLILLLHRLISLLPTGIIHLLQNLSFTKILTRIMTKNIHLILQFLWKWNDF